MWFMLKGDVINCKMVFFVSSSSSSSYIFSRTECCSACTILKVICLRFFHLSVSSYLADVCNWAGRAQSVLRLVRGWKVLGSNSGGKTIPAPVQTGPGTHPASCAMGTGSLPGGGAAGAWR